MPISDAAAPSRAKLYFVNSIAWLCPRFQSRSSHSRRACSATSAPAREIRSRKSLSASAFVSVVRAKQGQAGKLEAVRVFHREIKHGGAEADEI